jgi:hypothetical protein
MPVSTHAWGDEFVVSHISCVAKFVLSCGDSRDAYNVANPPV